MTGMQTADSVEKRTGMSREDSAAAVAAALERGSQSRGRRENEKRRQ